jgi:hypothetical protein
MGEREIVHEMMIGKRGRHARAVHERDHQATGEQEDDAPSALRAYCSPDCLHYFVSDWLLF